VNLLLIANFVAALVILRNVTRSHNHLIEHLDRLLHNYQEETRMTIQDAVNTVTARLDKVYTEVTGQADSLRTVIADLQAQIEAAGVTEQVDLSALEAAAEKLDDIVPDDVPAPVDVTPVDPPVDVPFIDVPVDDVPVNDIPTTDATDA
jgi:hypothetical protein